MPKLPALPGLDRAFDARVIIVAIMVFMVGFLVVRLIALVRAAKKSGWRIAFHLEGDEERWERRSKDAQQRRQTDLQQRDAAQRRFVMATRRHSDPPADPTPSPAPIPATSRPAKVAARPGAQLLRPQAQQPLPSVLAPAAPSAPPAPKTPARSVGHATPFE